MQTIDLVSAIISVAFVGIFGLRFGLMANTVLIVEVLWNRRAVRAAEAVRDTGSVPPGPFSLPPAR